GQQAAGQELAGLVEQDVHGRDSPIPARQCLGRLPAGAQSHTTSTARGGAMAPTWLTMEEVKLAADGGAKAAMACIRLSTWAIKAASCGLNAGVNEAPSCKGLMGPFSPKASRSCQGSIQGVRAA